MGGEVWGCGEGSWAREGKGGRSKTDNCICISNLGGDPPTTDSPPKKVDSFSGLGPPSPIETNLVRLFSENQPTATCPKKRLQLPWAEAVKKTYAKKKCFCSVDSSGLRRNPPMGSSRLRRRTQAAQKNNKQLTEYIAVNIARKNKNKQTQHRVNNSSEINHIYITIIVTIKTIQKTKHS